MIKTRTQRLRAAVLALVVAAAAAVAAAPAAPAVVEGVQIVEATSEYSSLFSKVAQPICPAPKVVVGISYRINGPGRNYVHAQMMEVNPDFAGAFATVSAVESLAGTPQNWSVTGVAFCSYKPDGYEIQTSYVHSDDWPKMQFAHAECSKGNTLIGAGGWSYDAHDQQIVLDEIIPGSYKAYVTAYDSMGTVPPSNSYRKWGVGAVAICAKALPGLERIASAPVYKSDATRSSSVACPSGKTLMSTGFELTESYGRVNPLTVTGLNNPNTTSAYAVESPYGGTTANWALRAWGVCADQ
ncbi:hypothetical protein ACQPXM_11965 [Kribbella sp. CA-253562]|uniref:hypothetical protein n=1 Tax=Kribbella sp. CA-253562 TaxID=3239942 RepID=UPI003D8A963A